MVCPLKGHAESPSTKQTIFHFLCRSKLFSFIQDKDDSFKMLLLPNSISLFYTQSFMQNKRWLSAGYSHKSPVRISTSSSIRTPSAHFETLNA